MKLEIPNYSPVKLDQFKEIIITNFLQEQEMEGFNLNQELLDYFSYELSLQFKGKIASKNISLEKEGPFKIQDFWKNLAPDSKEALFFTGKAQFSQETRKALLERERTRLEDSFSSDKTLAERKVFTLVLNVYLIKSETGEIIYEKEFKETKNYQNPKQAINFAFYDLMQNIKLKFLRNIQGAGGIQERYLISR